MVLNMILSLSSILNYLNLIVVIIPIDSAWAYDFHDDHG